MAARMSRPLGSSPRLRGTLRHRSTRPRQDGIIPALAGNTASQRSWTSTARDHPRACGEHNTSAADVCAISGSSPRLRGTPDRDRPATMGLGIIPALAGNTPWRLRACLAPWDHPRACGEHSTPVIAQTYGQGSSPRLRGTHRRGLHD